MSGWTSPGTLAGRGRNPDPEPDERNREHAREQFAPGDDLLHEDPGRDDGHPEQAHHAESEQGDHQAPAAADTESAVLDAHPEGTDTPRPPAAEHEVQRAAAVLQADVLQRRQLVEARRDERAACDVGAGAIPGEPVGPAATIRRYAPYAASPYTVQTAM